jgi:hypothetical protein
MAPSEIKHELFEWALVVSGGFFVLRYVAGVTLEFIREVIVGIKKLRNGQ